MMNKYGVGLGNNIKILNLQALIKGLSKEDAINLIAWLAVLGGISQEEIAEARTVIES